MIRLKDIVKDITPQTYLYAGICLLAISVAYVVLKFGYTIGLIYSTLPLILFAVLYAVKYPYIAYTLLFVVNYYIMGTLRYVPNLPGGVVIDALFGFTLIVLLIGSCYKDVGWSRAKNGLTTVALIWLIFAILQIFNPAGLPIGWARSIRGLAIYFFLVAVITPMIFHRYKDLKRILFILSLLTLTAVGKALIQKYWGFDIFEKRWLYIGSGSSTHIIQSGTRYFSFFTDAGNFGAAMGMAMVIFSIISFYLKKGLLKYFYLFVAAAAFYGLIISGTRGALAVPFAGYLLFLILSKKAKFIILGTFILLATFIFLKYTSAGNSIREIRRMRTAFNFEDPSFQVRLENQRILSGYMKDLPFGAGLGMGGGKAEIYAPNSPFSYIPTDSWFVLIWVETGIIGLLLHIILLLYIIFHGAYLVMKKLKDPLLRGITVALLSGIFGIMVASYGNEILGQFPTAIILYMSMAFVFLSPRYDKEIADEQNRK